MPDPASPRARSSRRILLADCDAMFVSVARLEDPEGAGRAEHLIVGGTPDGRGVVASASYACRAFGVRSAMPTSRALQLCPHALVVPAPREAVSRTSRRIRELLEETAVVLEAASVDEFYLDLTGTERILGESLAAIAHALREKVLAETGISLSVGCGTNKLVAKLAAGLAKPGGVHEVEPGGEARFMTRFELADIPGIGPKSAERLARSGLRTVEDALAWPLDGLAGLLGGHDAEWLYRQIRGIDERAVEARGRNLSHSRETTFPHDLVAAARVERELLALVVHCAADLRDDGRLARTVTVRVKDPDFRARQASRTLDAPLESDHRIFEEALLLLRRLREARWTGVRLLGVTLSGLLEPAEDAAGMQLGLFRDGGEGGAGGGSVERDRDRELSRAVHALRRRYGSDAVLPGTLLDRGRDVEPPDTAGPSDSRDRTDSADHADSANPANRRDPAERADPADHRTPPKDPADPAGPPAAGR